MKELAKAWFGNSQQHSIHAQMLKARGYGKLANKILAEANEEWEEAKQVNNRLIELGITPVVEIQKYPIITDIKKMLQYDYNEGVKALPIMSQALSWFDDDYITKDMIQKFIIDAKEHLDWVKQHLNLIKEIGYQNYLIQQTNIE